MQELIKRILAQEKVRFIAVGGLGFIVNFLSLALLFDLLKLPIIVAQVAGAELAVLSTFMGNNFWAFRGHDHIPLVRKLLRFHASAATGILVNSLVVVLLVQLLHVYYGLALAAGSAGGLVCNYVLYRRFVFKTHTTTTIK